MESNQPYSFPHQTIKGIHQTEGKIFSLLAPPSELKQMLKVKGAIGKMKAAHGQMSVGSGQLETTESSNDKLHSEIFSYEHKKEQESLEGYQMTEALNKENEENKLVETSDDKIPAEELVIMSTNSSDVVRVESPEEVASTSSSSSVSVLSFAPVEEEKPQKFWNLRPQKIKLIDKDHFFKYYNFQTLPEKDGKNSEDPTPLPDYKVNELGEYCCRKCSYKTVNKKNVHKHNRIHIGTKPHICPICKYETITSSNLKRHMAIHKDIREFKCNLCSMSFRQKIHLERHVRYRHQNNGVKCPSCEQPDLKMHMKRRHTPFSCPQCQVVVGSLRNLHHHRKTQKDGLKSKLFCKKCRYVTNYKSLLEKHKTVHSTVPCYQQIKNEKGGGKNSPCRM